MTYRGQVRNGSIALDQPVSLPDGTRVTVEVVPQNERVSQGKPRAKLQEFSPIHLPGGSLADEIVRDRR